MEEDSFQSEVPLSSLLCQETTGNEQQQLRSGKAAALEKSEETLLFDPFVDILINIHNNNHNLNHTNNRWSESEEEEYIQMLLDGEKKVDYGFAAAHTSSILPSPSNWTRAARLESVDYILNATALLGFQYPTAYLAVNFLDRFLALTTLDSNKSWAMRLLSVACLSLAAKLQEPGVPGLSNFQIGEPYFEGKDVQRMELFVLNLLEWKIGSITPFAYLPYFIAKLHDGHPSRALLAKILQITMSAFKVNLMDHYPSAIALSSLLISLDPSLSRTALDSKLHLVPCKGFLDIEDVFNCYIIMQRLERDRIKTSRLLSSPGLSPINFSQIGILHGPPSTSSLSTKRKRLEFSDSGLNHGIAHKQDRPSET